MCTQATIANSDLTADATVSGDSGALTIKCNTGYAVTPANQDVNPATEQATTCTKGTLAPASGTLITACDKGGTLKSEPLADMREPAGGWNGSSTWGAGRGGGASVLFGGEILPPGLHFVLDPGMETW